MAPITESAEQPSMILFLGVTGAGKSYMINQLAGQMNAEEGSNLDSCMKKHPSWTMSVFTNSLPKVPRLANLFPRS